MTWDEMGNASLPLWGWLLMAAAGYATRAVWLLRKREQERARRWAEYTKARAQYVGTERQREQELARRWAEYAKARAQYVGTERQLAPLAYGGVVNPRVTRNWFDMNVNGRYLGREAGIFVRARSIEEAAEVVAANHGLTPRHETEAA